MRRLIILTTMVLVLASGFLGVRVGTSVPSLISVSVNQAEAGPYRRSVRRTARRTSRRHSYYRPPVYGGAVVVGTAIVIGTMVATLPPPCSTVLINSINYHNCAGNYYIANGNQWVVVAPPY